MQIRFRQIFTAAALCTLLLTNSVSAATENEKWYQAEILVFSYADTQYQDSEQWRKSNKASDLSFAIDVFTPDEIAELTAMMDTEQLPRMNYAQTTPQDEMLLLEQGERVANSKRYHLLVHQSWRIGVKQHANAVPVMISDELPLHPYLTAAVETPAEDEVWELPVIEQPLLDEESGELIVEELLPEPSAEADLLQALLAEEFGEAAIADEPGLQSSLEAPVDAVLDSIPVITDGPQELLVFGSIGLRWSRYLHLTTDITYRRNADRDQFHQSEDSVAEFVSNDELESAEEEMDAAALAQQAITDRLAESQEVNDFRIKEVRRIKRGKLYFFDHPLFGVLVKVVAYKPPVKEEIVEPKKTGAKSKAIGAQ
jgi:hypothetical protein